MATSLWDLPPWEQLPYCFPLASTITVGPFTNKQVIGANNQRIMLIFCPVSSITYSIWPQSGNANSSNVINMAANLAPLIFTSLEHGPLVTFGWNGTMNGNITVMELVAADWPKDGDHYLDSIKSPPPQNIQTVLPTKQGVGGLQGVSSYWKALMAKIKGG